MCLTLPLEGFDDNKVLENCQLDTLIFVQVYSTIDKNLRSLLGSGRTKEGKGINKKKRSLKRLKRTAPEVKVLLKKKCS